MVAGEALGRGRPAVRGAAPQSGWMRGCWSPRTVPPGRTGVGGQPPTWNDAGTPHSQSVTTVTTQWIGSGRNDLACDGEGSRRRSGQPCNRNAWKHGRRSSAWNVRMKLSVARLKALAQIAMAHGLLTDDRRFRVRPLRKDQMALLRVYDPEIASILESGWPPPRRAQHP